MKIRILIALVSLSLSGCSGLLKFDDLPEVSVVPDADAGMDMGLDGDADADPDAPKPRVPETDCNNGKDDNGNGFTDCSDFDCAADPKCCESDDNPTDLLTVVNWSSLGTSWIAEPDDGNTPTTNTSGYASFDTAEYPTAVVATNCLPLQNGAQIDYVVRKADCDTADCSDDYVSLVLSYLDTFQPEQQLLDELSVRFRHDGATREDIFEYRRGNEEKSRVVFGSEGTATDIAVNIVLGPGLSATGVPSMTASVTINKGGEMQKLMENEAFMPLNQLLTQGACSESAGLRLAYEGFGSTAQIKKGANTTLRECSNPSGFTKPLYNLVAADVFGDDAVSNDDGWALNTMAAPSHLVVDPGGAGERTHLAAEVSDLKASLETSARVGYGIGHRYIDQDLGPNVPWTPNQRWNDEEGPRFGANPPGTCPTCTEPSDRSIREPFLFDDGSDTLLLAASREKTPKGEDYEVIIGRISDNTGPGRNDWITTPVALVDDDCTTTRDPGIFSTGDGDFRWITYTCVEGLSRSVIRVQKFNRALFAFNIPAEANPITTIITPEDTESWGGQQSFRVSGAEPILERIPNATEENPNAPDILLLRIWFLVRSADQSSMASIGMTQVEFEDGDDLRDNLISTPEKKGLEMYAANPVLVENEDTFLPTCVGSCKLRGFSVTRIPNAVRFLLAYDDTGRTPTSRLIPLEQVWTTRN